MYRTRRSQSGRQHVGAWEVQLTVSAVLALLNIHPSVAVDLAMRFSKNCNIPGSLVSSNSFFRAAYNKDSCMYEHTKTNKNMHMHASNTPTQTHTRIHAPTLVVVHIHMYVHTHIHIHTKNKNEKHAC